MNEHQKADFIIKTLDDYFPQPEIPLNHRDAFTLLISVLLSAQTTDAQVNKVTPVLFERADTPEKMVTLSESELLQIIRSCGLAPQKTKSILSLSQRLLDEYDGRVPSSFNALESLPGVGHKTASVVMAQAFGIPAFPVDTHIHRLAQRWGLSSGKSVQQTEKDLKRIFSEDQWIKLHLQIIYFGRSYCPARGHHPMECPICKEIGTEN